MHSAGGTGQRSEKQFWSPAASRRCKTASSASSSVTARALDTTTSGEGGTETSSSISCDLEIRINTEDGQGRSNAARTAGRAFRVARSSGVFGALPPRKLEPMMTSKGPEEAAKSLIELRLLMSNVPTEVDHACAAAAPKEAVSTSWRCRRAAARLRRSAQKAKVETSVAVTFAPW